ncbi:MAG: hypothetical protein KBA26_14665, partial [Candidatus Delongbacteria bacterium]|nr:hypothetical protein [Candidatus Delongbacteria bacterium]
MPRLRIPLFIPLAGLLLIHCVSIVKRDPKTHAVHRIEQCIREQARSPYRGPIPARTRLDSVVIDDTLKKLDIHLSGELSVLPIRPSGCDSLTALCRRYLGKDYQSYHLSFYCMGYPIEELIPNFYRPRPAQWDRTRMPLKPADKGVPLCINLEESNRIPGAGLWGNHIAVWPSHGWYYSAGMKRWEWQRPRLFTTVEDLLPYTFIIPYLLPMLENAGAVALIPRERDYRIEESVVDNDSPNDSIHNGFYRETLSGLWKNSPQPGFALGNPPYPANFNPFLQGTARYCLSDTTAATFAEWIPTIPRDGDYAVYISYQHSSQNVDDAHYTVHHTGGQTR